MRLHLLVLDGVFDLGLAALTDTLTTANELAGTLANALKVGNTVTFNGMYDERFSVSQLTTGAVTVTDATLNTLTPVVMIVPEIAPAKTRLSGSSTGYLPSLPGF